MKTSFWGTMYVAAALLVFTMWVWGADTVTTGVNGDPRSTLEALISGTAHNPFVQRALVPFLTRTVTGILPGGVHDGVRDRLLDIPKVRKESARLGWNETWLTEYLVAFLLAFLSLAAFPFVLRSLFASLYQAEELVLSLVPLGALFVLPPFFVAGTHYVYDFPALLFFTLGLLLIVRRNWTLYYVIVVIGLLNKETMILLALPFFLTGRMMMRRGAMTAHLAMHAVLFAAVKGTLMWLYEENPGGALEFHLWGNIHTLLMPYTMAALAWAAGIGLLFGLEFPKKHPILRGWTWLVPVFLGLMLVFGKIDEIRDMYEVFPVLALLAAHTVVFSLLRRPYSLNPVPHSL